MLEMEHIATLIMAKLATQIMVPNATSALDIYAQHMMESTLYNFHIVYLVTIKLAILMEDSYVGRRTCCNVIYQGWQIFVQP